MAKYIVEIPDEIEVKDPNLVPFDMMRPSWFGEIYEKGLDKAWETCGKILAYYNKDTLVNYVSNYSPSDAIEMIQKRELMPMINVGDEVRYKESGETFVILRKTQDLRDGGYSFDALRADGTVINDGTLELVEPTGRKFPKIVEALKQMQGGNDE